MANFYCKYCGMKYSSIKDLTFGSCFKNPNGKNHVPYEGEEKSQYYCEYCGMKYSSIKDLTFGSCSKNPNGKNHFPAK